MDKRVVNGFEIVRYSNDRKEVWNSFVSRAQNATFLFNRNFMDYHADRFEDHSLMIFFEGELIAVLPANQKDNKIYSHAGLTYGGLAFVTFWKEKNEISSSSLYRTIFNHIISYYYKQGFKELFYKEIPTFYQKSQELSDFLSQQSSIKVIQEDIGAVIDLQSFPHFWHGRIQSIKKANLVSPPFRIEQASPADFWNELLIPQLKNKYNLNPTHTLEEITLLIGRFSANIKQYNVYYEGKIISGAMIFEDSEIAHCQYIASNDLGKRLCATDFLFHKLITQTYKNFRYFSFGISNWHGSTKINKGLLNWKISWGANICKQKHFMMKMTDTYI